MTTIQAEEYQSRKQPEPPFEVRITSYRLGDRFHCSVDDVDPGAVIVRAQGRTRDEAEHKALESARKRLAFSAARMSGG